MRLKELEPILPPVNRDLLRAELTPDRKVRDTHKAGNEIYIFAAGECPALMREVGRLREMAFRGAGGGTGPAAEPAGFVRRMAGCGAHCPQRGLHCERRQAELHRDVYRCGRYLRVRCKKGLPISGKALLHFASYLFSAACASYSAIRSFRSYWYLL